MTSGEISDALRLEEVEFAQFANEVNTETEAKIRAMESDMAARGLHFSGPRYKRDVEIRFAKIESIIERAILKRKQIGDKFPGLLTPPYLDELKKRLDRCVDTSVQSQYDRMARDSSGIATSGLIAAVNKVAEQTAGRLRNKIANEIEILRLEARLGLNGGEQSMTFKISNSTIANLNLGTVLGDLSASVHVLSNQGHGDIADQIRTLTEALGTVDLSDDRRRELLEHLSVVSNEVALPPEKRKLGPLRSSIDVLREGLTSAAQLAALWPPIEQTLRSIGIFPPS